MIVLSLLSELIAFLLVIISPVISYKVAAAFILAGILRCIILTVVDMDKDYKTVLTTSIISFMFYIGIILKLVLNLPTSQMYKETLLGVAGIIVGSIIAKLIYTYNHLIMSSKKAAIITGATTLVLFTICTIAYKLFMATDKQGNPLGDGSIAIGSFTLQLPEFIKILLVLVTFVASLLMYKNKTYIWFVYISSVISCVLVAVYFKEFGTPLLIIYFTLAIGISLSTNHKYECKCKNKVSEFLNSGFLPSVVGTLFFFAIKILKDILYQKYPLRGSIGEEIYKSEKWFDRSQRLWADAPQTAEARNILKNASLIPLNLNFEVQIPNCEPETAISDYCTVVLSLGFGKFITILLLTTFVTLLAFTFIKSDYLGKAASLMMISQVTVQISGIMGFCFTGVNIPFISAGASSMFSSFVLLTFIIYSMRRNTNA